MSEEQQPQQQVLLQEHSALSNNISASEQPDSSALPQQDHKSSDSQPPEQTQIVPVENETAEMPPETNAQNATASFLERFSRNSLSRSAAASSAKPSTNAADDFVFSLNLEDYELMTLIGFGSSAVVYLARYKPLLLQLQQNKYVAIKIIDLELFERNQIEELRKELQAMSLCKHPNLLNVIGSFVNGSKLYIVTPFLSAGSCLDIMKTAFPDGLDEPSVAIILKQVLQGLDYLHKNGLIHRDVKAGNLLMDEDGTVVLADFGVSSSLYESGADRQGLRKTFVGTPCWIAPEVVQQTGHDFKADIWSFGITALELAHGRAPFAKFPPMKVLLMTLQNDPPTLDRKSKKFTKAFKEMIDTCLQKDPRKRPSAEKLLQHSFFKNAKKKQYLIDSIVKKVPPVQDRSHKEPKLRESSVSFDQSWDFSDIDEPRPEITSDEEDQENEIQESPVNDDLADSSNNNGNQDQNTISESTNTIQQKKGRFVVDITIPNANNTSATASQTQPPQTHTQQPMALNNTNSVILSAQTFDAPTHSRTVSVGQAVPSGALSPPLTQEGEIRKGRFQVIGDVSVNNEEKHEFESREESVKGRFEVRPIVHTERSSKDTDVSERTDMSTDSHDQRPKRFVIVEQSAGPANPVITPTTVSSTATTNNITLSSIPTAADSASSSEPSPDAPGTRTVATQERRGRFEVTSSTTHSNLTSPDEEATSPSNADTELIKKIRNLMGMAEGSRSLLGELLNTVGRLVEENAQLRAENERLKSAAQTSNTNR